MRIAVVTPYYKENKKVLARCLDSVQSQSMTVDHILVSDGYPQDWVENRSNVSHIIIRKNSGDFGDTPRSVGYLIAMRGEYDFIQFLDADNLLLPEHFSEMLRYFSDTGADVVIAKRFMMRPDGTKLNVVMEEDEKLNHIDTSCFMFSRTSFHIGLKWAFIPKQLGFIDDRVFYKMLRMQTAKIAVMRNQTVGYSCLWPIVYKSLGEPIPKECKDLGPHMEDARRWWHELAPERKKLIESNLGISITTT